MVTARRIRSRITARARKAAGVVKENFAIIVEVAGFGLLALGVGLIFAPAGLITGGVLLVISIERTAAQQAAAELAEKLRRRNAGISTP